MIDREQRPLTNLSGERVALGPLRPDLAPLYAVWHNDFETQALSGFPSRPVPRTMAQVNAWIDGASAYDGEAWFTIYRTADWQPVGFCGWRDIDQRHRTAEYAITIGDVAARGQGLGTEVTRLMLRYAFGVMGLHSVLLSVYEYNPGAVRAYEKAGFRHAGRLRQRHLMGRKLWDVLLMDCLADEFEQDAVESGETFRQD